MRIAKPLLLVTTPIGVVFGLYEGWRLAGGLVFLMLALVSFITVAMATVVVTVRRERREEEAARAAAQSSEQHAPGPGESK
jgi:predicted MFS family arabinose efflux permease